MKRITGLMALCSLFALGAPAWAVTPQVPPLPVASCAAQIPYGMPVEHRPSEALICRHAYLVRSDLSAKIPVWVSYTLTPDHTVGCVKRSNAFTADKSLRDGEFARKVDYAKSGYDIGHQADDADMDWDPTVERESFILTNMAPQTPALNRGIWKVLETDVRAWAHAGHSLTVYVGPIWNSGDPTIGDDHVVAAHAYFKIVIDDTTHQSLAFIMPNLTTDQGDDIAPFQVTVQEVDNLAQISFPVPDSKTARHPIWPVDLSRLAHDKKATCKAAT